MIFSIDEKGDLALDLENGSICNKITGDRVTSDYKLSKTIILTHFKHYNVLKDTFYKNKRNMLTDAQIENYFDDELNKAFYLNKELLKFIKYEFLNSGSQFDIFFYFYSKELKKPILDFSINI